MVVNRKYAKMVRSRYFHHMVWWMLNVVDIVWGFWWIGDDVVETVDGVGEFGGDYLKEIVRCRMEIVRWIVCGLV